MLRRDLLSGVGGFLAASLVPEATGARPVAKTDAFYGGSKYAVAGERSQRFALVRFSPGHAPTLASCSFFPHAVTFDHLSKRAFAFEKIGAGAAVFDLASMEVLSNIEPLAGRLFYGHGAVSNGLLYSTETDKQGKGWIGIRDAKTLKPIGDFPTYGEHPHDCHLLSDGRTMAVTNGGGSFDSDVLGSVVFVDIQSTKLLERFQVTNPAFNAGHYLPIDDKTGALICAPRAGLGPSYPGAVFSVGRGNGLQQLSPTSLGDRTYKGEALSAAYSLKHQVLMVTHPTAGVLTVWSKGQVLGREIKLDDVRGVSTSPEGDVLYVTHGRTAQISRIDPTSLSISASTDSYISGSHLIRE
jgi:uncharacterized protein